MKETFPLKKHIGEKALEETLTAMGLQLTMKGSLKTLPANIHWHYKKPKEKGTLEITLLLETYELIVECKKSRWGDWAEEVLVQLLQKVKL